MRLQWIFFSLVASISSTNILTKIGTSSKVKMAKLNTAKYFDDREPTQATIWDLPKQSFAFHMLSKEQCQEVWVCTTGINALAGVKPNKLNNLCKNYIRFRPMEDTVTVGLQIGNSSQTGETKFFQWTRVFFKHISGNKYQLEVADEERDVNGKVPKVAKIDVKLDGLPLIVTSSPYCQPILQSSTSGRPVSFAALTTKDFHLAYQLMREDHLLHTKKFNGLLVPTVVEKYSLSKNVNCPSLWISEFEKTDPNWPEMPANKAKTRHMLYTLSRRGHKPGEPDCNSNNEWRSSFKLVIDNPEECSWIRLCFLEDGKTLCSDPTKSVELLLSYKLFVGIDSDQARSMDVPVDELRIIRFELEDIAVKGSNAYRFVMSHSFASDEGGVKHNMYGEHMKDWVNQREFKVSLARDEFCRARIVMDHLLETNNKGGKQCLSVKQCQVVRPEKYAAYPGSEELNMDNYRPE